MIRSCARSAASPVSSVSSSTARSASASRVVMPFAASALAMSVSMPSRLSSASSTFSTDSSRTIASVSSALRARLRSSFTVSSSNASISSISVSGTYATSSSDVKPSAIRMSATSSSTSSLSMNSARRRVDSASCFCCDSSTLIRLISHPVISEARRTFWPLRPIAIARFSSSTTTSIACFSSSTTMLCTSAGASALTTSFAGSSDHSTMSTRSPASSLVTAVTREPRMPMHVPCGSRRGSLLFTAIFARMPGSRAAARISISPSSISGTSSSNRRIRNSGEMRDRMSCGPFAVRSIFCTYARTRSPTRCISFGISWSRVITPSMRPDSTITLPRSMRLTVPVSRLSCALEEVVQDLLALGVADLLQDHLLRRLRADAAELDRLERLLDDVAELEVRVALGGVGDRELVRRLLVLLVGHDGPAPERIVVAGLAVDRHARVDLLVREALLRRRRERRFERREHDVLRHVLLARERVHEQQQFAVAFGDRCRLDRRRGRLLRTSLFVFVFAFVVVAIFIFSTGSSARAGRARCPRSGIESVPFAVSTQTTSSSSPAQRALQPPRAVDRLAQRQLYVLPGEPGVVRRLLQRPVEPRRAHLEPLVVDVLDREQPRQVTAHARAILDVDAFRLVDEHADLTALRRQLDVDQLEAQRGQRALQKLGQVHCCASLACSLVSRRRQPATSQKKMGCAQPTLFCDHRL